MYNYRSFTQYLNILSHITTQQLFDLMEQLPTSSPERAMTPPPGSTTTININDHHDHLGSSINAGGIYAVLCCLLQVEDGYYDS